MAVKIIEGNKIIAWLFRAHRGVPVAVFGFYLLLRPYLCFISFLYLNLYVLGDDALIS